VPIVSGDSRFPEPTSGVWVRVCVAGEHYAVPVERVLEVAEPGDIAPVPGAPSQVIGVRNLRGQIVPVISLATLLGLPSEEPGRIVVTEVGERRAGLAVEGVFDVDTVVECSEPTESPYLSGAALIDGTLVGVLDVEAILAPTGPGSSN
jgi:purine-binding chemotaxis protein CheW